VGGHVSFFFSSSSSSVILFRLCVCVVRCWNVVNAMTPSTQQQKNLFFYSGPAMFPRDKPLRLFFGLLLFLS
jgi:hypothetical protein